MKVFLDFEASSLADQSHPIEIAWVFQDGRSESHLIAPAPVWDDWDPQAEAIHGISRATLAAEGKPYGTVAHRMVEALTGHDLFASAPSWDGKWLSVLLRAGGFPRHLLRLRDTDEALRETATEILRPVLPAARLEIEVHTIVAQAGAAKPERPAHRALADATEEYETWARGKQAARDLVAKLG
jgi:DNA polymerase III epsilon subunit-like protein